MISFIIPTLLKSSFLPDLLKRLEEQETVGEIILINNVDLPLFILLLLITTRKRFYLPWWSFS